MKLGRTYWHGHDPLKQDSPAGGQGFFAIEEAMVRIVLGAVFAGAGFMAERIGHSWVGAFLVVWGSVLLLSAILN